MGPFTRESCKGEWQVTEMITKQQITDAITALGLKGRQVCVHTSMGAFGEAVEDGTAGVLQAFMEQECTLLVPTFSDQYEAPPVPEYMPEQNGAGDYSYFFEKTYEDAIFHTSSRLLTVEEMGVFPKAVLEAPGSVRGDHPLNSFTALGNGAEVLVGGQTAADVYAPLRQLYENDGYVLLMGVGLCSATAIHYAEQRAGRSPFIRWAKGADGKTVPVRAGGCSDGFERLANYLQSYEKTVTVGNSLWRCFRMRELVDACVQAILENPEITHCKDPACDRCNDAVKGGPIRIRDF